jgi:hypothetical protein
MRSNSKLALAALLGVLMVSAIASASASAGTCVKKEGSKKYLLCVAGSSVEETATIEAPAVLSSTFVLELPKEWEASISCTGVKDTSAFKVHALTQSITRSSQLALSGCVLQGHLSKKCRLSSTTYSTTSLAGTFGSLESIVMAPEFGTVVFEFSFSNQGSEVCPAFFAGDRQVAGGYECKLGEAKLEAVEHALTCANSGAHKLKTAGEEDPLHLTQTISLGGTRKGQKFSIYEG